MFINPDFARATHARTREHHIQSSWETRSIVLRKMEIGGEKKTISIRLLETGERIRAACDLINNRYAWRGYGSDHQIPADAYHMTFTAEIDGKIIGTITLAVDSPRGLAVDTIFKDEIDRLRILPGGKVCELTRFAFDPGVRSKELMAALFHIVFVYGHRTHGCTDLVIEVSPRHARFYEAMLGFERVGAVKMKEEVATMAQFMWLKVATIRERIDQLAGRQDHAGGRSLYPFFFSPREENGIYQRLSRAKTGMAAPPGGAATYHAARYIAIERAFGAPSSRQPARDIPVVRMDDEAVLEIQASRPKPRLHCRFK